MGEIEKDSRDGDIPLGELESLFESTFSELTEKGLQKQSEFASKTPLSGAKFEPKNRVKTSLRMKYEAEVETIKKSIGDLEDVRKELNLSKRKMCQLLMVDPSAWTRWTKEEGSAPPHIYRALQWYMILQDKHPEMKSSLWLNSVARPQLSKTEINAIRSDIIQSSKEELYQSTLEFFQRESHKRINLEKVIRLKTQKLNHLKTFLYIVSGLQILLMVWLIAR